MKTTSLMIAGVAIAFSLGGSAIGADAPPNPTPTHAPVCTFTDDAGLTLNIKRGEVDALVALINDQDHMSVGQLRMLQGAVNAQLIAIRAKYCK